MKRLILALLFVSAPALGVTRYISATGSTDPATCGTFVNPCDLRTAVRGSAIAIYNAPGDIWLLRGGTYKKPDNLATLDYFDWKSYGGNHLNPVTVQRYQDEEVIVDCGWDITFGSQEDHCFGAGGSATPISIGSKVTLTQNSPNVTWKSGNTFVTGSQVGNSWVQQSIHFGTASNGSAPYQSFLVSSVTDSTHLVLTTPWTGQPGDYFVILPASGRYYKVVGLKFINTSQRTRVIEHGRATMTNGANTIDWQDGGTQFEVNPTATIGVTNSSTRIDRVSGTAFACGNATTPVTATTGSPTVTWNGGANDIKFPSWTGQNYLIEGVNYPIAHVDTTTSLTLSTPYTGPTNGHPSSNTNPDGGHPTITVHTNSTIVTADPGFAPWPLPGVWNGLTVFLGSESYTIQSLDSRTQVTLTGNFAQGAGAATYTMTFPGTPNGTCGSGGWAQDDIVLNGVVYRLASVQTTNRATLTSNYLGATNTSPGVSSIVPGNFSSLDFNIYSIAYPSSVIQTMTTSYCPTATQCIMRTNFTKPVGGNNVDVYPFQMPIFTEEGPMGQRNIHVGGWGSGFVNCYFYDRNGGDFFAGQYGANLFFRGNVNMYPGVGGGKRSYGHGFYLQNRVDLGEWGRSVAEDNMTVRPFCLMSQVYSEDAAGFMGYITQKNNTGILNGTLSYPLNPSQTWPTGGSQCAGGSMYFGSNTGTSNGCPPSEGGTGSPKTATGNIVDGQWLYAPSNAPFTLGGGKGTCKTTIKNSRFIQNGVPIGVAGGTYPPLIMNDNVFMFPLPININMTPAGTWTHLTDPFAQPGHPNTYTNGIPTSGPDVIKYIPNQDESGKGFADVDNQDSSSTVTVDLCQMGGFNGEKWVLMNAMTGMDPWHPVGGTGSKKWSDGGQTAISGCPTPFLVTMSATVSASEILQPAMTIDGSGSTAWPKPPDAGPRFVAFSLERDFSSLVSTPTPSPTTTPSNTPTVTNTPSSTPTLTPTNTPSRTPTFTPSLTPTGTLTPSSTNTPTFTPSSTPSTTPSLTATRTPTFTPTPGAGPTSSFNFADPTYCTVTAPMVVTNSGVVDYPFSYVSSPTAFQGQVSCTFTVQTAGSYRMWVKAGAFDTSPGAGDAASHDSFYIDSNGDTGGSCVGAGAIADAACKHIFDAAEWKQPCDSQGGGQTCVTGSARNVAMYNWLNDRLALCGVCGGNFTERRLNLLAGVNTVTFHARESGARLYYATITQDLDYVASDPPIAPTPVPVGPGPLCVKYMKICNVWYKVVVPCVVNFIPCPRH